ncbi:MAG TPA: ZIP family metal transporter [Burkholderiales bacterium]|nr:ZIP family metal transporter [Burkholderiales bacterium]
MILLSILGATLAAGVLSVLAAAAVSFTVLERWAPRLIAFAVGVLLAAAFLHLLPEAVNEIGPEAVLATCLGAILALFMLEKAALWRHAHVHGHGHGHGGPPAKPSGMMILLGDTLHNFVDGVLIAAAFLADPALGWAVAIGIIAHEVPQEVGDFMILLDAGYSRRRALILNALVSFASVAGGVLGFFLLAQLQWAVPYVLALAGASFLYIAVADLMPELQRHWDLKSGLVQLVLIGVGIAVVAGLHSH